MVDNRYAAWCAISALALAGQAVPAQSFEPALSLGVVAPLGGVANRRTVGPVIRGTVDIGDLLQHTRLRVELEHATMPGRWVSNAGTSWHSGPMRAASVTISLVRGHGPSQARPDTSCSACRGSGCRSPATRSHTAARSARASVAA